MLKTNLLSNDRCVIKTSVWEACTLNLEFTSTIFIADTRQVTLKTNRDPSSALFGLLFIHFILSQLNFVSQGEALSGNSLLITWSEPD